MEQRHHVLSFAADLAGFETAFGEMRAWLDECQVPMKAHFNAELVFEEIVTNIVKYGYEDASGETVAVELAFQDPLLTMVFDDGGVAFDPLKASDPDLPSSIDEAKIGGLGIMLVRKAARDLSYERSGEGRNRLTVTLAAE